MSQSIEFGSEVVATVHGFETVEIVIGVMRYAGDSDNVVLVADDKAIGMPVNVCHLKTTGLIYRPKASMLRKRYEREHPDQLKPLSRSHATSSPETE